MDVKSLLKSWMSGSIPNDGIILRHSVDNETDTQDYGSIKVFSKETNTIYQPKIRIGWDDQSYVTGSLKALTSEDIKVGITNLKTEVKVGTTPKIRVFARELYPIKTFTNQFAYSTSHYLPTTSYYQIKDVASDDIIIPFSDYSKISCDENGNYINLNLSNWEAGRTYKMEFKINMDGNVQYFDEDITFTIVKN
jgi:flagellin-like hook-associated protein FlgL